ncbi:LytR C-terminal domain-containing protein [Paenarthrobacter sp. DKR-5]|uniref:LytR C-terminal domain-containing protein n=1 Tax=Paenarthrobacter sp. DKR-5 TaxID=2835535 RepID=UPI001BDD36A2|nr:LytR C-terminal domain-containing protein [Paenarthrobacter sp. DKR-5]MBT1003462.1 LytR C-terminal domain-containing protein [Paenarthrobacter sp. DKR-5]
MTEGPADERARRKAERRDPDYYHGHHVVNGDYLREVFAEDPGQTRNPVRFRHRLTHAIVLTFLVVLLVSAGLTALAVSRGDLKLPFLEPSAAPAPAQTCPTATFRYLPNKNVTVNVFNGTFQEGRAASVAAQLKARGYKIGKVGNKPTGSQRAAVIVSGPAGQAAAYNLQRNIAGTEYVADRRSDASVDVVLAPGYSGLVKAERVDQSQGRLSCPQLSPSPAATSKASPKGK